MKLTPEQIQGVLELEPNAQIDRLQGERPYIRTGYWNRQRDLNGLNAGLAKLGLKADEIDDYDEDTGWLYWYELSPLTSEINEVIEEFGPDAKDEMSPADYIQYCLDQYYEYRTLAMDPTINDQATKLYSEKASDYYARAQEAMDKIEPDNIDHLSDEDKALPNVSLADQESEMNESDDNTEVFTNQYGEKMTMMYNPETGDIKIQHSDIDNKFYPIKQFIDRFVLNNEEQRAIMDFYKSKHKMNEVEDDKLSDEEKAMIDKYEEEEANREVPRDYASMYERFAKIAGLGK